MAMGANVAHGKGTTEADYYLIIKKMMALPDGKYMKNVFEPDVNKIADAIGAARPKARSSYSNYFPNGGQSLSQQCTAKRDAAILEQHQKGLSGNAIAKMFGLGQTTVAGIIRGLSKIGESPKLLTPENTSIPLASTERGTETLDPQGIRLSERAQLLAEAMGGSNPSDELGKITESVKFPTTENTSIPLASTELTEITDSAKCITLRPPRAGLGKIRESPKFPPLRHP